MKPTTKEEKTVSKTDQVSVVTTKEEASKVNQTLVSSQPTIGKAETPKVDQTPTTTAKVEAKKLDQAPAAEKPVATEPKESTSSNPVEEKKQTEEIAAKKATEGTASKESPTSAAESEGKVENSAPATNVEESTTVEKQTEINKDQEPATVVNPAETPVATEAKESTPSNSVEEKKQTEGTTPKETTEEKVDNKEVTSSTDKTSKENPTSEEVPTSSTPSSGSEGKVESSAPTTTEKESTTVEKKTETNADQASAAVVKPTTNTPSKDSAENNEIAPSTNNSSNEGEKHETVVPKEVTQENKDALDSHKQIKLKEINESSLTPEQKEQAITKVKELTTKAEKAIEGAATSEEQANVVDQYEKDLIAIVTPNVETPKPDFTKPIESHNPTGSTTIGEGGAISTLTSSTPVASTPAVSESAANTPVVSTTLTASVPAESAPAPSAPAPSAPAPSAPAPSAPAPSVPATSVPTASAPAESVPATSVPTVSTPVESIPATSVPTASTPAESTPAVSTPVESVPEASTPAPSKPTSTEAASSPSTATNPSVSDTSASNTNSENTGFRNAPAYQPRVVRRVRSVDAPKDQVAIYYNFAEMKDIAGFLGDPGESIITVPAGATADEIRTMVKAKIDAKKAELAKRGYTFMEDYFVDKPQEDTIRYDYVVNFTKAASLRVAPVSQPRAARNRRSVVESPIKTRTITFYYQLAGLEIAGALGTPGKNYVITVPETASATEIQQAIDDATRSEKAELGRFFKYVRETNLQTDILNRGFGNFDYVITFTR